MSDERLSNENGANADEITAEAFLDLLEKKDIVAPNVWTALRKQVVESKGRIPARRVAKLLVDKGVITAAMAQRFLAAEARPSPATAAEKETPPRAAAAPPHSPAKSPPKTAPKPPPAADHAVASLLDEELPPLSPADLPSSPAELPLLAGGSFNALLDDPALAAAAEEGSPLQPLAPAPAKKGYFSSLARRARRGGRNWSRVLLWAGAGVVVLAAVAATVVWALTRPDPDQWLTPADDLYKSGSYAEAVEKYDDFLSRFPRHPLSGRAKVRRGLARLQASFSETAGAGDALEVARSVLPAIHDEAEFDAEAGSIVAALLPPRGETLAAQARRQAAPAAIERGAEMLSLAEEYIPAAEKPCERLGRIEASLALTRRQVAAGDELDKAVAAIAEATAAKDYIKAHQARDAFLNAYPAFAKREELAAAVEKIAAAERAAVAWTAKRCAAEKSELAGPSSALILARRTCVSNAPGAEGRVILAAAAGAVYGLDAANGSVLWRRFVGFPPEARDDAGAAKTATLPSGDAVILAAAARREIQCLEAATGRLRWRWAIDEPFVADPVVGGSEVFVAVSSGRLAVIDAATGESSGFVQLPLPLSVAPAVDARRKLVFQLADRDDLFALAMPGGRCRQVLFLGHAPGSVAAPPVLLGDCLLAAVNETAGDASLLVMRIEADDPQSSAPPLRLAQAIRLRGHVDAAPSVAGERALVATDAGEVRVFELAPPGASEPLHEMAGARLEGNPGVIRFPLLQANGCFIDGVQLTSFDIQSANQQLAPAWRAGAKGAATQPPCAVGASIYCVRRAADMPGVVVSAVSAEKGDLHWQTCLAAPLVAEPIVDGAGGRIVAATSLGDVFRLEARDFGAKVCLDQPAASAGTGLKRPASNATRCANGALVLTCGDGSRRAMAVDLAAPPRPPRTWLLPGPLSRPPIALAGGLAAPSDVGQAFFLEPSSGKSLGEPFQPRLRREAMPRWREPVATGDKEFALTDGRARLYRLQIVDKPAPRLEAAGGTDLKDPIVSPLARVGMLVCGVDAAGQLACFKLPELTPAGRHAIDGRCAWGPRCLGQCVLLATDSGQLHCFDLSCEPVWQTALAAGPLAGVSPASADGYFLAYASGVVCRLAAKTGKELGRVDVGQPLAAGPVLSGKRLFVAGCDGVIHSLSPP